MLTRLPDHTYDKGFAVAFDDTGRIVVAGTAEPPTHVDLFDRFLILRYLPDGRLDTTFGTSGFVVGDTRGSITDVAIDTAGRIVVAGEGRTYVLARYESSGTPDATFGTESIVRLAPLHTEGTWTRFPQLALDSRGRIIFVTATQEIVTRVRVTRFLASGDPDPTFGEHGEVVTASPMGNSLYANDVTVDSSDRVVVCGSISGEVIVGSGSNNRLAIARYLEDGRLDPTFSGDGFVLSEVPNSGCRAIAIRGSRITVGGQTNLD